MIIRAVDANNDWLFGKGKNNYKKETAAIVQNIDTKLKEFLGDCFFATDKGIDWWNLLGGKDLEALRLSVATTILTSSTDVTAIQQLTVSLDPETRAVFISYAVDTVYTPVSNTFSFSPQNI